MFGYYIKKYDCENLIIKNYKTLKEAKKNYNKDLEDYNNYFVSQLFISNFKGI